jgi:hypothetical protein
MVSSNCPMRSALRPLLSFPHSSHFPPSLRGVGPYGPYGPEAAFRLPHSSLFTCPMPSALCHLFRLPASDFDLPVTSPFRIPTSAFQPLPHSAFQSLPSSVIRHPSSAPCSIPHALCTLPFAIFSAFQPLPHSAFRLPHSNHFRIPHSDFRIPITSVLHHPSSVT